MFLIAFATGFLAAIVLTPAVRALARRFGFVDIADGGRKTHEGRMPLLGGLAVFLAFAAGAAAAREGLLGGFLLPKHLAGLLTGGAILVLGGALDDRFRLRPLLQLAFPAAASLAVIASGIGADLVTNPFGGTLRLDLWNVELFERGGVPYFLTLPADLFTFAWLMGMTYTTKLLDGLDGLVAGLGFIGAAVLALLALSPEFGQPELARLAMAFGGACLGFLFFNARPASVFLGEGGSTLVGFTLGTLAILAGAKIGITLLVLAVPVLDAAWTVFRRLAVERVPLASGDRGHLHFRLLDLGLGHATTVRLFWLFSAGFGAIGLFLPDSRTKALAFVLLAAAFACLSFLIRKRHGKRA